MNKESFLETLRQRYRENIHAAWQTCEHKGTVDRKGLTEKLTKLMNSAKTEGLPIKDFEDLVKSLIPERIVGKIDLGINPARKKKAA